MTAQPHSYERELTVAARDESDLSIDPEDLGNHFLTEAVEQGDSTAPDAAELEVATLGDPESEERPSVELSVWNRMIELAGAGGSPAGQLEAAAAFGAAALDAERGEAVPALEAESERAREEDSTAIHVTDSAIRDRSLLDREGPAFDETVSPEIDSEDGGHHARLTSRESLGDQVRGAPEPAPRGARVRSRQRR